MVGPVFWLVSDPVGPLADLADRTLDPVVAVGPGESADFLFGEPEQPEYY